MTGERKGIIGRKDTGPLLSGEKEEHGAGRYRF